MLDRLNLRNKAPAVNIQAAVTELSRTLGPPKSRAPHGQWIPYAWLVRGLVERGHEVSAAVRHVLENSGVKHGDTAFESLRMAFYKVRTREWPAQAEPEPEEFE